MSALYKESLIYSSTSPSEDHSDLREERHSPIDVLEVLHSDFDKVPHSSCTDIERE